MGYIRHNAIVVTGSGYGDRLKKSHEKANELGLLCTPILCGAVNGYESFLIAPDGSKEGWGSSNDAEAARAEWIKWARENASNIDWALITFGGDDSWNASLDDWNDRGANDP